MVVSYTVHTILPCGLRAVINITKIVSPLPVVDHYGVLAGAIPPFPTFFPSHLRPRTPIRRDRHHCWLIRSQVRTIPGGE
jgi:hypothetical protein